MNGMGMAWHGKKKGKMMGKEYIYQQNKVFDNAFGSVTLKSYIIYLSMYHYRGIIIIIIVLVTFLQGSEGEHGGIYIYITCAQAREQQKQHGQGRGSGHEEKK